MINTNELRIGNFVKTTHPKHRGEPMKILAVTGTQVSFAQLNDHTYIWFDIANCKPIRITAEILEKCGFKLSESERRYEIDHEDGHKLLAHWNSLMGRVHAFGIEYLDDEGSCSNFCWNLNSLHQLQNLYFALTGEELNITL